jgi:putative aldouronate transport system substrate-binding protein
LRHRLVHGRCRFIFHADDYEKPALPLNQNLALASGTLPDLFFATSIQANSYGPDGVFEALDDLLAKNAPNFMKLVNDSPDSPFLKNPDNGKMYFMPKYYSLNTATEPTFTYRKDILQEMGEKEPATMDEWYQLFKKVKAKYPNMVVLCERGNWVESTTHLAFDMGMIDGWFGIIGSDFAKHQIAYLPITNEWKDMLTYYNKLYTEGLLDPEYLTIGYNDWWEGKIGGGRAFAC